MSLRDAWRGFIAPRTTVAILVVLAVLCLLMVVVPQRSVLGDAAIDELTRADSWRRVLLIDLRLAELPTSPVFLAVLGLFFANLTAVLLARVRPTLARIAPRPLSEKGLVAWARLEESLRAPRPSEIDGGRATSALRDAGYRPRRVGERTYWGVRHRTAPLGFLIFHASFFLLAAGGVALYYTRFVAETILIEGQPFTGYYSGYLRQPPTGRWPQLRFVLAAVDPRMEGGRPISLRATLAIGEGGAAVERETRVNAPAQWGSAKLFVIHAGLAPVVWLQDDRGFTLDRVNVAVGGRPGETDPTTLDLAEGRYRLSIHPLAAEEPFPERDERVHAALRVELEGAGEERRLLDAPLRAGEVAEFDGGRLVIEEMRYWAVIQVVAERGGALLIAGFVLGIGGIVWRLLLHRREVAVTWDDEELRVVGRSEYFSRLFRRELEEIMALLTQPRAVAAGVGAGEGETA